jgi:hypothetical protein
MWVVAFLGALRLAQDYVIFPRLVRRGIHMHPLGVILAILSGAELAGMAGIFLAIPAVAVLSVMHRHLLEHRGTQTAWSHDLMKPTSVPSRLPRGPRAWMRSRWNLANRSLTPWSRGGNYGVAPPGHLCASSTPHAPASAPHGMTLTT